jgi:type II secretory ATPase GspE/PulE/Tfp pilus assembly ATPase PilB-like protein
MQHSHELPVVSEDIATMISCVPNTNGKISVLVADNHKADIRVQSFVTELKKDKDKYTIKFVSLEEIKDSRAENEVNSLELDLSSNQKKVLSYFNTAKKLGASDIHLLIGHDNSEYTYVEMRIHGELDIKNRHVISKKEGMALASTICQSMCDVSEKQFYPNNEQSGRIKEEYLKQVGVFGARYYHVPAVGGLYVVMRVIPDDGGHIPTIPELGFLPEQEKLLNRIIRRPEGIIIFSGPTGSGKSRTLRVLSESYLTMTHRKKRLLTIEDPPEGRIPGAVQTPIIADKKDPEAVRLAWVRAISSALRLDPDAILNGEMKEFDSALAAINAAMTGHKLLTTLHANDAISIMERLVIMGMNPALIADAQLMIGLISQRLVQRLCPHCKKEYLLHKDMIAPYDQAMIDENCDVKSVRLRNEEGCKNCHGGIIGRAVVSEVIMPDAEFMRIYLEKGKAAARSYWHYEMKGITRNQHLLHYVNNGDADPLAASDICSLDEDKYTLQKKAV